MHRRRAIGCANVKSEDALPSGCPRLLKMVDPSDMLGACASSKLMRVKCLQIGKR